MTAEHSVGHLKSSLFGLEVNLDTLFQVWGVMLFVLFVCFFLARSLRSENIKTRQFIAESVYDMWESQVSLQLGKAQAKKYLSYIGGIFLFILFIYWSGLLPWKLFYNLGFWPKINNYPWQFVCPVMDINMPLGIALLSVIIYLISGIQSGGLSYILAFLGIEHKNNKFSMNLGSVIFAMVEILDILTRPVTLVLRIYANVLAGEALSLTAMAIFPVLLPTIMIFFEFSIGILQAFIFAMLSLVYISIASSHGHEHEHEHESIA